MLQHFTALNTERLSSKVLAPLLVLLATDRRMHLMLVTVDDVFRIAVLNSGSIVTHKLYTCQVREPFLVPNLHWL